jgi:plasmid replication initiation protein
MDKGRKPNQLIQAGQELSALQLKALLGMLTEFKVHIPAGVSTDNFVADAEAMKTISDVKYNIPLSHLVPDFSKYKGGELYKRARAQIKGLMAQSITFEDESKMRSYNLVSYSEIDKGTSEIVAKFNSDIVPVLVRMVDRGYTEISLEFVRQMKSSYSIRIYELLMKNRKLNHVMENGYKVSLEDLRFLLGVGDNAYSVFGDFKRRVLMQAAKEINSDKTNLRYEYEPLRTGRKITHIRFYNIVVVDPHLDTEGNPVEGVDQAKMILEPSDPLSHLNKKDALAIKKQHSPEYITYYYKHSRTQERKGVIKKSFDGFFFKQLTEDPKDFYNRPTPKKAPVKSSTTEEKTLKEKTDEALVIFNSLSEEIQKTYLENVQDNNMFLDEVTLRRMAALKYSEMN